MDLASDRITRAMLGQQRVEEHPDTGERLVGAEIPYRETILEAASRCAGAGIDEERGPLILEVNARPRLELLPNGPRKE